MPAGNGKNEEARLKVWASLTRDRAQTIEDLARNCKLSKSMVRYCLVDLEERGKIRRGPNSAARAIVVLEPYSDPLPVIMGRVVRGPRIPVDRGVPRRIRIAGEISASGIKLYGEGD